VCHLDGALMSESESESEEETESEESKGDEVSQGQSTTKELTQNKKDQEPTPLGNTRS
jgi:hypothetical protein